MATASEIRSITSSLRTRSRSGSVLELGGVIARATAALTQGRPSGITDSDWAAFTSALRTANEARIRGPVEAAAEMVFTAEEAGLEPAPPTAPAPTGKVAQAAEAVTQTVGQAWEGVKRAVGLPEAPAAPSGLPSELVDIAEQVMEEAEARGVSPQQVAQQLGPAAQQAVATVQRQVAPPFYTHPAFVVGATLGGAGIVWFIAKALKKRKAQAAPQGGSPHGKR